MDTSYFERDQVVRCGSCIILRALEPVLSNFFIIWVRINGLLRDDSMSKALSDIVKSFRYACCRFISNFLSAKIDFPSLWMRERD